jgi:hypothetical protein
MCAQRHRFACSHDKLLNYDPEQYTGEENNMDSKLRAQVLTMAAATLGLSLVGGCAKKQAEPEASEAAAPASGAEHSCGAAAAPAEGAAAPAEGTAEGGGESSCGGGSCGAEKK